MYVKFVILEGFKSYRDTTRVGPFDPHFNAITGLNGSGKSNILDAICFVLGISSMSVVRCKNLADCIYMGQGKTLDKACVSIILDNSDKTKSPPGQQKYDEIVVSRTVQKGGDCRYHINRIGATKRAVTDLFESVQLNVNNPNFMIMQGKITKVVNMKPKELLHMIEETVGATLYQAKREKAENELRVKEQTVASVENLIHENIKPNLDKQTKAYEMIQEYNIQMREKNDRSLEFAVAHYFELQEKRQKSERDLNKILEQDQKDDELAEQYKREIKQLKQREEQMKKENTSRFKEKVDAAEKALQEQKKRLHSKETDVKTAKEGLDKAKKALKDAEKTKQAEEKHVADFKNKSAKSVAEFEELQQKKINAEQELEKAKEQENQIRSGKLLDEEGKSIDVTQELNRMGTMIANIKPELEDKRKIVQQKTASRDQLARQLRQTPSDDQSERNYKQKEAEYENLRREAARKNINAEESVVEIRNRLDDHRKRIDAAIRQRDAITRKNYCLQFSYDKERIGTDGIYGCVVELIKIHGVEEWGNAIEAALGGFVGHIIVDNDRIGKNLVQNGRMNRRTYVHPLSTFQSSYRPAQFTQQTLDQKFGVGNAIFAKSLLEYDPKFRPVIEHYVGNKILCKTMDVARHIAFKMNTMALTTAGDSVDPGGIMQGGTRHNMGALVKDCVNLYDCVSVINELGHNIGMMNQQLQTAQANEQFIQMLEKAKRELQHAEEVLKLSKYSQIKEELETIDRELPEVKAKVKELETEYNKLEKTRAQLQKKADEMESHQEKQMKETANRIKKFEKELETVTSKFESRKKYFSDIEIELTSKMAFLNGCQKDIDDAAAGVQECQEKIENAQRQLSTFMEQFQEYQKAHDDAVAESNEWFEEARQIQEQIKALDKSKEASELNKMKRNNQRTNYQENVQHTENQLEALKEQYPAVDFPTQQRQRGGKNAAALKRELDAISKRLEDMQQRLDHDAAASLPQTKREFAASTDKVVLLGKNKKNLVKAIETLDLSKKHKVRTAYDDVNKKFNDMMQTLLPEARARLVEVVPGDLSQGVNIHVQLGGVWKESLTELSGGQRSLVALSLVLSLCMYNPAPFYILDEVDAALDLSHTQNIGVVIQRQFKGTQFICVSLKDGMFSNANVLFTAKHEGGRSVVVRSTKTPGPNRAMPPPEDRNKKQKTKK